MPAHSFVGQFCDTVVPVSSKLRYKTCWRHQEQPLKTKEETKAKKESKEKKQEKPTPVANLVLMKCTAEIVTFVPGDSSDLRVAVLARGIHTHPAPPRCKPPQDIKKKVRIEKICYSNAHSG